eukprot:1525264-Amphidinium_carterae.2
MVVDASWSANSRKARQRPGKPERSKAASYSLDSARMRRNQQHGYYTVAGAEGGVSRLGRHKL